MDKLLSQFRKHCGKYIDDCIPIALMDVSESDIEYVLIVNNTLTPLRRHSLQLLVSTLQPCVDTLDVCHTQQSKRRNPANIYQLEL